MRTTYGAWTIERVALARGFDWCGWHKDYDGAPLHSLDEFPADDRCFHGATEAEVREQIDTYEAERDDEPRQQCPSCGAWSTEDERGAVTGKSHHRCASCGANMQTPMED